MHKEASHVRWVVLLLVCTSLGAGACGKARPATRSSRQHFAANAAQPASPTDSDEDGDFGGSADRGDNGPIADYGHAANAAELEAIASLARRYYETAASENGGKACTMLSSILEKSVPEDYGRVSTGPPYMHGTTCPAVLTLLFKHFHSQIANELPELKIVSVRVAGHHGVVILRFADSARRSMQVTRDGTTWKVGQLIDSELR